MPSRDKPDPAPTPRTDPNRRVDLEGALTLEETFGCDPWDDENFGRHPSSRK